MTSPVVATMLYALATQLPAAAPGPLLAALKAEEERALKQLFEPAKGDTRDWAARSREYQARQWARSATALQIGRSQPGRPAGDAAVGWAISVKASCVSPDAPGLYAYAERHLADKPAAVAALQWVSYDDCPEGMPGYKPLGQFVHAVAEKHPDRAARGFAHYCLAQRAYTRYIWAELARGRILNEPDPNTLAAPAEEALDAVVRDFGSEQVPGAGTRVTLRELAAPKLHELQHLLVGKPLPRVAGTTLDGKAFDPAVTGGKVTLVVFWASWCGPCLQMVPTELKLAKTYAGRPFVIVGVNGDDTREAGLACAKEKGMTWASVWEDPKGETPLSKAFALQGWPTVYVADAQGVIRHKGLHGKELEEAVGALMRGK